MIDYKIRNPILYETIIAFSLLCDNSYSNISDFHWLLNSILRFNHLNTLIISLAGNAFNETF